MDTEHRPEKANSMMSGNKCFRRIMTLRQISDCSMRVNGGLLSAYSTNVNYGYIGMWHVTQKLILLVRLSLKGIIRRGGDQEGAHKVRGWGKSVFPVRSYLVW